MHVARSYYKIALQDYRTIMVQVKISEGVLEGEVLDNVLGGTYYSFKGIPYAAPPVGDLRFKPPQNPQPWDGIRKANKHGPICHQFDMFSRTIKNGSEDCLYLNVYSPNLKPTELLPVMFWIHGGAFISGSGNSDVYGPDFLVKKEVVLVTINYRLEILGFLCLDTKDVPGNAGMKDQVAALRWVNNNISQFGGDPNNITIFGESAGAGCVGYHLVSPMTKGLFKRAILQSGTNLSYWSQSFEPRLRAEAIAQYLGKNTKDDKELYEFFKSQPFENLVGSKVPLTVDEASALRINVFTNVVSEKEFDGIERYFYGDPEDLLRNGIHEGVEVMIGFTTNEGVLRFNTYDNIFDVYSKYLQSFVPAKLSLKCSAADQIEIGKQMKQHYFGGNEVTVSNVDKLLKYVTLQLFKYDIIQHAKISTKSNRNRLYLYQFDCYSERNIYTDVFLGTKYLKGKYVCHCDDLMYLFDDERVPIDFHSKSYRMIQDVTTLWSNFARHGNPTPDESLDIKWPTFNNIEQKYLFIGDDLAVSSFPAKEEIEFWEHIYSQYLNNR